MNTYFSKEETEKLVETLFKDLSTDPFFEKSCMGYLKYIFSNTDIDQAPRDFFNQLKDFVEKDLKDLTKDERHKNYQFNNEYCKKYFNEYNLATGKTRKQIVKLISEKFLEKDLYDKFEKTVDEMFVI